MQLFELRAELAAYFFFSIMLFPLERRIERHTLVMQMEFSAVIFSEVVKSEPVNLREKLTILAANDKI